MHVNSALTTTQLLGSRMFKLNLCHSDHLIQILVKISVQYIWRQPKITNAKENCWPMKREA